MLSGADVAMEENETLETIELEGNAHFSPPWGYLAVLPNIKGCGGLISRCRQPIPQSCRRLLGFPKEYNLHRSQ
jgi:hypothetical protein